MPQDRLDHLTLLYVEDEERLGRLMEEAIGPCFRRFLLARDGGEGLELFRRQHPDIVVTDITIPGMDGLVMAAFIRRESPETPIVVLSAYSDKEKLLTAIDTGIRKYFIKPFDPDELLEYLRSLSTEAKLGGRIPLWGDFLFDSRARRLYRGRKSVPLTPRELSLLEALLAEPDRTLDRQAIKKLLWPDETRSDDAVRVFIKRLRDKTDKELIHRRAGYGYTLETSD
ncbi:response regulator transcription factor [Nitratifractor sp.]